MTQLYDTAYMPDMSAVSHSRHVCCVKLGEGKLGCDGEGRSSDKATNEKVPYIYICYIYIYIYLYVWQFLIGLIGRK